MPTTFAKGDKLFASLFQDTLQATGRFTVTTRVEGAQLIGKLEISRSGRGTNLVLSVFARGGALLIRSHRMVATDGSVVDAAEQMAKEIAAADRGEVPVPDLVEREPAREAEPPPPARPPRPVPAGEDWTGEKKNFTAAKPKRLDFLFGAELGFGPWSADSAKIVSGSSAFDLNHYAQAFTRTIDKRWHPAMNLHGGWKFLNYAAIESAFQSSLWTGSGGAMLAGVRASVSPLQAFLPERKIDLGIELGFGYAFVGGSSYDMSGSYLSLGLTGEYALSEHLGVTAFYRFFTPYLGRFYIDYKAGLHEPVSGFSALWNTFGVGLDFHYGKTW